MSFTNHLVPLIITLVVGGRSNMIYAKTDADTIVELIE